MKISKQAQREAKSLFRGSIVNGAPDESRVRRVVQALISQKPRGYLAILEHFRKLMELDQARRTARVETPTQLSPDLQAQVREKLASTYGPGISVSFALNPALIGGMRIQVGSDVYDGTVRGRLTQLQNAF